jgi:DNA-directed RNA polymerase II subunit RPB2
MMKRGDAYRMAICNHSGTIAIYNKEHNNFYSPIVDGPLAFEKTDAETLTPSLITKYGKEFSVVEVPYCLKLLIHELTAMNIQMRLITSDNIENLTSYGKHSLGTLNKFIERAKNDSEIESKPESSKEKKEIRLEPIKESENELDANEQKALVHDIERLKKSNKYTPEEEQKSKQSILDLKKQLKQGNINQSDYDKLLIPEPEPVPLAKPVSILKEFKEDSNSYTNEDSNQDSIENPIEKSNGNSNEKSVEFMSDASDEEELKEYTPVPTEVKKITLGENV